MGRGTIIKPRSFVFKKTDTSITKPKDHTSILGIKIKQILENTLTTFLPLYIHVLTRVKLTAF